jgi:hypothetical protein
MCFCSPNQWPLLFFVVAGVFATVASRQAGGRGHVAKASCVKVTKKWF